MNKPSRNKLASICVRALVAAAVFTSAVAVAAEASVHPGNSSISVLDSQGRVVKTIDSEQDRLRRNAQAADTDQQRAAIKAGDEQRRKDAILTGSYTTESEIDLARQRATSAIEAQMEGTRQYSAALTRRRAVFEKAKKDSGKPLATGDEQEFARLLKELDAQDAALAQKKMDLERVNARYAADKQRWQELTGSSGVASVAVTAKTSK